MPVIVADRLGRCDTPAFEFLRLIKCDLPIVLVSRVADFQFNNDLYKLDKFLLCDFVENGWQWDMKDGHHWGKNTEKFDFLQSDEYKKFDEFIASKPPELTFCRELLEKDVTEILRPIEYVNWQAGFAINSRESYLARPIEWFNFWGRSSEYRVQFHGDVWKGASKFDYSVCDNIYFFDKFMQDEKGKKVVSLWMPHYHRIELKNLLAINSMSKLSISLYGAGTKCFRTTGESCCNSLMVKQQDFVAYTFPFKHMENCLTFPSVYADVDILNSFLSYGNIYELYCECVNTANKYRVENYIPFLEKKINAAIS